MNNKMINQPNKDRTTVPPKGTERNRYFYLPYIALSKITQKEVFSNICLRTEGGYINHDIAIKTILSLNKHYNPVILNIIEMSKEEFEQFSAKQDFKELKIIK